LYCSVFGNLIVLPLILWRWGSWSHKDPSTCSLWSGFGKRKLIIMQ
jgi:hypothetical protein